MVMVVIGIDDINLRLLLCCIVFKAVIMGLLTHPFNLFIIEHIHILGFLQMGKIIWFLKMIVALLLMIIL